MSDTEPADHDPVAIPAIGGPSDGSTLYVEMIDADTPGTDHQGFNFVSDSPEDEVRVKVQRMAELTGRTIITFRKVDGDPPTYYGLTGRL